MTSTIKVNNIQNQCGANIINENSNTITIGASGDTIALASGASQTGFGREGSVNWQTGSIKTAATFTAASGEGYFVDTSSNAVTANLPAGSAGAIVAFSDYARNFATNNLTISPNGSEKIGGVAQSTLLNVNGQALTLVYVDATKGWINVQNAEDTEIGQNPAFIAATGGTTLTCGDFKTHVFTGPGTFSVSCAGNAKGANTVEYAVVAGGGGGSFGGGGGGGFRQTFPSPATGGFAITASCFPITVGGGGVGRVCGTATPGSNSIFSSITSAGGGRAGGASGNGGDGDDGGSGGGAGHGTTNTGSKDDGGSGNVPAVSPAQGFDGGQGFQNGCYYGGGGGGGAGAIGTNALGTNPTNTYTGGNGGVGAPIADSNFGPTAPSYGTSGPGSGRYFSGGGGGAYYYSPGYGEGGAGGGGRSASSGSGPSSVAGTVNTGGGGGGSNGYGRAGGSGIVIIRYKFQ